jgi:UDP-N-acetyl-D-glucosamine dehydrogenase
MSYTEPSGRYIEWTLEGNQRQPHSHSCLAYELDIDDEPESLSYVLMELLTERGAEVEYHDPNVATTSQRANIPNGLGKNQSNKAVIAKFDLILIAINHSSVDYQEIGEWAQCIVDSRNAMGGNRTAKVWKA